MQLKQMKFIVAAISALVALSCGAVQAAPTYTVTDLGTLGGAYSQAAGINDSGQVVGTVATADGTSAHAFLYSGGIMTDLGTLDASNAIAGGRVRAISHASGINNSGQIVGYSQTAPFSSDHAFLYSGGSMTDLGNMSTWTSANSYASSINANGQVVGFGNAPNLSNAPYQSFLYSDGVMTDLGPPVSSGVSSYARDINDSGQVVGEAYIAGRPYHAFMFSGGVLTDIGTLGGRYSAANGINNSGQIVGWAHPFDNISIEHAFLYSDGSMIDLGTLGSNSSIAVDINDSGQVVGTFDTFPKQHAFLYSDGVMTDLNSLIDPLSGWTISDAKAINNLGQIAANGCSTTGLCRALLLTPVPEPETYMMMLAGLGLVGAMARRRNNMRK